MKKSASIEGEYRYELRRVWGKGPPLVFIGLNPSVADEDQDDMTITILTQRARNLGLSSLIVVNLYALRSTNTDRIFTSYNPVGPLNSGYIVAAIRECKRKYGVLLCGWGSLGEKESISVLEIIDRWKIKPWCLGVTKNNQPRHPLRISYDTPLVEWKPERRR